MVRVVLPPVNKMICQAFKEPISPTIKHNLQSHREVFYLKLNWIEKATQSRELFLISV